MAANTAPIFALTPNIGLAQISTANTNRDGTGTIGTVFTAGVNGSIIERSYAHATVTTTAGMIRVFLHDGTNYRLIDEVLVSAITPSATVAAFDAVLSRLIGLVLKTGYSIRLSTEKAETFNVAIFGGDY